MKLAKTSANFRFTHCDHCFIMKRDCSLNFWLTSCGHVYCKNCLHLELKNGKHCERCKRICQVVAVDDRLPKEVQLVFDDLSKTTISYQKALSFQTSHAMNLFNHLNEENKRLQRQINALKKKAALLEKIVKRFDPSQFDQLRIKTEQMDNFCFDAVGEVEIKQEPMDTFELNPDMNVDSEAEADAMIKNLCKGYTENRYQFEAPSNSSASNSPTIRALREFERRRENFDARSKSSTITRSPMNIGSWHTPIDIQRRNLPNNIQSLLNNYSIFTDQGVSKGNQNFPDGISPNHTLPTEPSTEFAKKFTSSVAVPKKEHDFSIGQTVVTSHAIDANYIQSLQRKN